MRFVNAFWWKTITLIGVGAITLSCSDVASPEPDAATPSTFTVEAVRLDAVRLTWSAVADGEIVGYAIERRANLTGPFLSLVGQVPQSNLERISWIDTDVEPETYYGYRVFAVTRFGKRSLASVIGGAKTPSRPGIEVNTTSLLPNADAVDPDGYELTIAGPDTVHTTIGVAQRRRFTPLKPGRYDVKLSGMVNRCSVDGSATGPATGAISSARE